MAGAVNAAGGDRRRAPTATSGTCSAPAGAAHKVVLTSATNGAAVADAILVVAEPDPEAGSFEWAPTRPSAGLACDHRHRRAGPIPAAAAPTIC